MKRLCLLFLILSIFTSNLLAQNGRSWPNTLLWKISGNGLTKSSFLYGTMHLQDKRLFYFTDSLYHYLEQVDGYSMEIDLREMMDSVLHKLIDEDGDYVFDSKRMEREFLLSVFDPAIETERVTVFSNTVIEGINFYLSEKSRDTGLVAMIARDSGGLLRKHYTREMASHTHLPLLVMHDA